MSFARRPVQIVAATLVLVLGGLALSACTGGQTTVRNYGDPANTTGGKDYYDNFMFGCTNVEPSPPGATPVKSTSAYVPPKSGFEGFDYCKCVYDGMDKKVPFPDAKAFEDEQANAKKNADGTYNITVPKNIQTVMDSCSSKRS